MQVPAESGLEMIEEWDWETARPTGRAVLRRQAHREGIPHEGVHLWVVRTSHGRVEVLFQHRAGDKELFPDCLDITVGGHVTYGTARNKIQKEAYEEMGITPEEEDLVDLGYFRYEERDERHFHREFQRVYLLLDQRELDGYVFTDGEVIGVCAVPLDDLERLLLADFTFTAEAYDGKAPFERRLSRRDFHPLLFAPSMKEYMGVVFRAVRELAERGVVTARMPSPVP